jgi:hypothetical protein
VGVGSQYIAGVFSGNGTKSQRAAIPALLPSLVLGGDVTPFAAGLDLEYNTFNIAYNITGCSGGRTGADVEAGTDVLPCTCFQRLYAHRALPHVLVNDVRCSAPVLPAQMHVGMFGAAIPSLDVHEQAAQAPNVSFPAECKQFTATAQEEPDSKPAVAGLCAPTAAYLAGMTLGSGVTEWITFSTQYSSVDDDASSWGGAGVAGSPVAAAARAFEELAASGDVQATFAAHQAAYDGMWQGGHIEVGGNTSLAAVVNASLMALMSAVRENVTFSSSPGGLATNGCACGASRATKWGC